MNTHTMKGISALLLLLLAVAGLSGTGSAQENQSYLGTWDNRPVEVNMTIASTGKVSGCITEANGGAVMAVFNGTNYAQGKLRVSLKYRFEDLGTVVLSKSISDSRINWSSGTREFSFSRSRT